MFLFQNTNGTPRNWVAEIPRQVKLNQATSNTHRISLSNNGVFLTSDDDPLRPGDLLFDIMFLVLRTTLAPGCSCLDGITGSVPFKCGRARCVTK